jgi:hypothetical protein
VEKKIEVQENSAVLSFDLPARTSVQCFYGTDQDQLYRSVATVSLTESVELNLSGLEPGRIWYFRAVFTGTNGKKVFYRNGAFKTPGQPALRLDSVRIEPEKYGGLVKVFVSALMDAALSLDGVEHVFRQNGKTEFSRPLGMTEELFVYETRVGNLKPGRQYPFRLEGGSQKGESITWEGAITTLENNVALAKPVQGTFTNTFIADKMRLTGDVLSRVTDGSFDYFTGMAVSTDPGLSDQWVVVDLKDETPVEEIVCYWRAAAYPEAFSLSLSRDAVNWSQARKVMGDQERVIVDTMPVQVSRASFGGERARYVRLFFPAGGKYYHRFDSYRFLQLVELKVFPKE